MYVRKQILYNIVRWGVRVILKGFQYIQEHQVLVGVSKTLTVQKLFQPLLTVITFKVKVVGVV